jgi:protein O-GlcNAc transferase
MSRTKKRRENLSYARRSSKRKTPISNEDSFCIDIAFNAALQQHQSGQLDKAEELYKNILHTNPSHASSLHLLGLIAYQGGKTDVAAKLISKAVEINPESAVYLNDMGVALNEQGKTNNAIACYEKAVEINPGYADAYYNMGNALNDQGKAKEAIACYEKAVAINPEYVDAYYNMGNTLKGQGKAKEATACYEKAVEIDPDYADAYHNMGNTLNDQGKIEESIACYEKAVEIDPNDAEAINDLVRQLQQTCAWEKLEGMTARLDTLTRKALDRGKKPAEHPFLNLTRHADPCRNSAIAKSWGCDMMRRMPNPEIHFAFDDRRSCKKRITVGYLSNDFQNHATAHLMLKLFGLHNRDEFTIYCYSYGKDDRSFYRAQIQQDCDQFIDLDNLSNIDAAKCIYEDQVDILVDLKGYTKGNRLAICALRPAPIQVNYLGFPGTTGADFFDYIITDRIVTPEHHAPYYAENFVYLPHCYQVNDHTQLISNKDLKKTDLGLPESSFVCCSFNQGYKIEPIMFDVWMKILRQLPECVLWLLVKSKTAERNLREEAEKRGVQPERLIFAKELPKGEHLARLRLADLALDTRIYNGHTTTSDALWAGVPVITLQGSHFASRVSSSILTGMGLCELITHNLDEYEALAVRLIRSPGNLKAMREKLAKNRKTEPLFDTSRFADNIERAYKEMWKIFLAGERPRQIEVVERSEPS